MTVVVDRIPAGDAEYVALPQVNTPEFIGSIAGILIA